MRVRTRSLAAAGLATAALAVLPAVAGADGFPLVGWWPMNEGSGQVVRDWSGHGNNGTLGNSPSADSQDPSWIPGVFFGSALRFDGNDIVQIPDSTSLDPQKITVSVWFRGTTSPGINKYVVSKGSVQCDHASYGLYTSSTGGMAFYVSDSSTWHRSPEAPASVWDGKWHNAAGTWDGVTARLFIDGKELPHSSNFPGTIDYTGPTGPTYLGGYHAGCDLLFTGDLDQVMVWSTPLPVADIWAKLSVLFNRPGIS
jgi:hypothetical protein